jgi:hypothetical protein
MAAGIADQHLDRPGTAGGGVIECLPVLERPTPAGHNRIGRLVPE